MKKSQLKNIIKEEIRSVLKESVSESGFDNYKKALEQYDKNRREDKYDRQLSSMFSGGSKMKSRFLFRSSEKRIKEFNYKKDVKDFGAKFDDLVLDVLAIFN